MMEKAYYLAEVSGENLSTLTFHFRKCNEHEAMSCKKFTFIYENKEVSYCFNLEEIYAHMDAKEVVKNRLDVAIGPSAYRPYLLLEENAGIIAASAVVADTPDYIVYGDVHGDMCLLAIAVTFRKRYDCKMIDLGDDATFHRLRGKERKDRTLHKISKRWGYDAYLIDENERRKEFVDAVMKLKYMKHIIRLWGNHDGEDSPINTVVVVIKNATRQIILTHGIIAKQFADGNEPICNVDSGIPILRKRKEIKNGNDTIIPYDKVTNYIWFLHANKNRESLHKRSKEYIKKMPEPENIKDIEARYRSYVGSVANENIHVIVGHDALYGCIPYIRCRKEEMKLIGKPLENPTPEDYLIMLPTTVQRDQVFRCKSPDIGIFKDITCVDGC